MLSTRWVALAAFLPGVAACHSPLSAAAAPGRTSAAVATVLSAGADAKPHPSMLRYPDIEVIDDPALMVDGGDPQLDQAIAHMLEELKRNPYVKPKRPAYPDRSGMGVREQDK